MVTWIQTASGKKFDFLSPSPESVLLDDIAQALSRQCRFNGHLGFYYSVAEHSVHVSHLVPPEHAVYGLLHDATEAFVGDLVAPLKGLCRDFRAIEKLIWTLAIAPRFGLPMELPDTVKEADLSLLAAERSLFSSESPDDWKLNAPPAQVVFGCWDPEKAKRCFLERAFELGVKGDP